MKPRVLAHAIAAFGLGLLTSVLIAWAAALAPTGWIGTSFIVLVAVPGANRPLVARYEEERRWGADFIRVSVKPPQRLGAADEPALRQRLADLAATWGKDPWGPQGPPPRWPAWLPSIPGPETNQFQWWSARVAGWPWPCLRSRACSGLLGTTVADGAGAVRVFPAARYRSQDAAAGTLPLIPHLPGLAGDAAVFAMPWFCILLVIPAIRRHHRFRRGHCPHCDYDLAPTPSAAACPECGSARPA